MTAHALALLDHHDEAQFGRLRIPQTLEGPQQVGLIVQVALALAM